MPPSVSSPDYWYAQSGKGDHQPVVLFNAPGCPPGVPLVMLPDGTQLVCSSMADAHCLSAVLRHLVLQQLAPSPRRESVITGEQIRAERTAAGMSVYTLAAKLDVPFALIEALEREPEATLSPAGWAKLIEMFPKLAT